MSTPLSTDKTKLHSTIIASGRAPTRLWSHLHGSQGDRALAIEIFPDADASVDLAQRPTSHQPFDAHKVAYPLAAAPRRPGTVGYRPARTDSQPALRRRAAALDPTVSGDASSPMIYLPRSSLR